MAQVDGWRWLIYADSTKRMLGCLTLALAGHCRHGGSTPAWCCSAADRLSLTWRRCRPVIVRWFSVSIWRADYR